MSTAKKASAQRPQREKLRFPIEKDVCYLCVKRGGISAVGVGKTYQISSREVRFTTQYPLRRGERVRLAVDWPAMLGDACLMKLEIRGSVIRSLPGAAAVSIASYEFRTRGAKLKPLHSCAG